MTRWDAWFENDCQGRIEDTDPYGEEPRELPKPPKKKRKKKAPKK